MSEYENLYVGLAARPAAAPETPSTLSPLIVVEVSRE